MKPPLFIRPLSPEEHQAIRAGLRSPSAFTLRRSQILLASAEGNTFTENVFRDNRTAVRKVLARAGLTLDQMDLVELNEAFAAQVLACLAELPIDPDRLNVNGGAIALGHPLGCTGAKLTATLVHELARRQGRYGLVTMCVGGGMGAAGIFERV